jgi:hypothetical protein
MPDVHTWLDQYRNNNTVEGWVNDHAFGFLDVIYDALNSLDRPVRGGVLEIGVHHGKFFIALNALVEDDNATSLALDLFENQDLNIDFSGRGNREHFEANLAKFDRHSGKNVVIHSADSTAASAADLLSKAGNLFKVISVDGGHTAELTIADIMLANAVMHPQGFVIVDDILNSHWLGVIDGVAVYLRSRPTLWPLAIGFNKLIMCRMSMYPAYFKFFKQRYIDAKITALCGYNIIAP